NAQAGLDRNVCLNSTATLGTSNNVNYTYSWHPTTNLSAANIANPVVTATSGSTTYTVFVSQAIANSGGLVCTKSDEVVVNTLALPSAPTIAVSAPATLVNNANPSLCEGSGAITLTPSGTAGNSQLQWLKNNTQVTLTTNLNAVVNISNTGGVAATYTAKVRGTNGCFSPASNAIVATIRSAAMPTIIPAGTNNIILLCFGGGTSASQILTASVASGSPTYSWYQSPNTLVGTGNTYMASVNNTTTSKSLRVSAVYPNTCVRTTAWKVVRKNTTCREAMEDMEINQLAVFPNPSSAKLQIAINNSQVADAILTLTNSLGQIVQQEAISLDDSYTSKEWDISKLPFGIYHLSLDTKGSHQTVKVMKE
ncbi:MAG: T9SS type A sorting domain-containing protein, partial [Bacteroidia bacterium]